MVTVRIDSAGILPTPVLDLHRLVAVDGLRVDVDEIGELPTQHN